jgi:hypothetical protein
LLVHDGDYVIPLGGGLVDTITNDPFWSVVRRRQPDVDIVLLPPEPPPAGPSGQPPQDPAAFAEAESARVRAEWAQLVGERDEPTEEQSRWIPGPTPDSVARETTLVLEGADPVHAVAAVERAVASLTDAGWHLLVPPTGSPRVVAGRSEEIGRRELQLVFAHAAGRLVLRVSSAGCPVAPGQLRSLLGGTP